MEGSPAPSGATAEACTACGSALREGDRFCAACGTPRAPARCPGCGAETTGGRYCSQCGTPLNGAPTSAPRTETPVARVAERRLTTILFADLVGFTPFSEARDAEEVREALSQYFDVARTIVTRYGGTVEKFIGDAVMAVWGVPTAHEDDAERAVRAGLDLTAAVADLGEALGARLELRVGVTTGEVAVTVGATGEGMVAGDAVNTAARVQAAAAPGTVWVDETTRSLTAAAVDHLPAGTHLLKGKEEPVELFVARAVVAGVGGAQRPDGLEAPFTGHDRQLRLVKELLHETVEERKPRVVLVSGPAGVGKTRLAWEFDKYADGLSETFAWHRGRCLAYGDGVAFWALADAVRTRLGLTEGDTAAAAEQRLAERLPQLLPEASEREWVGPRIAALVGLGADHSYTRDDLFAAWTLFLERAGGGNPVIVVIDDLQLADDALLDFLDHLATTAGHAVFVLGLTRPELLERRPALATHRRISVVHLEPLGDGAMAQLLDGLVGGLTDEARDALVARAEGIPLYAVETLRALIDQGVVTRSADGPGLVADAHVDLAEIAAPASLQALLASRLDALPPAERRVIAHGSVLGRSFTLDGLEALDPAADGVRDAVANLIRRDVLAVESDRFAADRGQLRFVQAAVRQVAYEMLSRRDRKAAHLAAAAHLQGEDAAEDLSPLIAQHLLDALAASNPDDPDRLNIEDRAVQLLQAAASRARALGAAHEALRHLELGLEHARDPESVVALHDSAAQAAFQAGDAERCLDHAAHVRDAWRGDPVRLAPVIALTAEALEAVGRTEEAIEQLRAHLAALDAMGELPPETLLPVLEALAALLFRSGDMESSLPVCERQLRVAQQIGEPGGLALGMSRLAVIWGSELPALSLVLLVAASDHAHASGDPQLIAFVRGNEAAILWTTDLDRGIFAAQQALAFADRADAITRAFARINLVVILHVAGRWREAFDVAAPVLSEPGLPGSAVHVAYAFCQAQVEASGAPPLAPPPPTSDGGPGTDPGWAPIARLNEARRRGDRKAAAAAGAAVLDMFRAGDTEDDFAVFWIMAVLRALDAGDVALAERHLDRVRAVPTGLRSPYLKASLTRLEGLVARHRGDDPEALLTEAIDLLDAFGARAECARTRHDLAAWLAEQGRTEEMAPLVIEARAVYEEIGADAWLADLDRLAAGVRAA